MAYLGTLIFLKILMVRALELWDVNFVALKGISPNMLFIAWSSLNISALCLIFCKLGENLVFPFRSFALPEM